MAIKNILIIFIILVFKSAFAQEGNVVDINANLMEFMEDKRLIIFTGDVVAKRNDITLYCSKLEVFYKENEKTKKKEIDYMIAKGDVKVVQKDRIAKGDLGKYLHKEDIIILEGNPVTVVEKGENQIIANKITFFMKENRSTVEGSRPRVIFKMGD